MYYLSRRLSRISISILKILSLEITVVFYKIYKPINFVLYKQLSIQKSQAYFFLLEMDIVLHRLAYLADNVWLQAWTSTLATSSHLETIIKTHSVNLYVPLSCCEQAVVLSNQRLSILKKHGNSQQGAELQWYIKEKREITFLFLFEVNVCRGLMIWTDSCASLHFFKELIEDVKHWIWLADRWEETVFVNLQIPS